MTSLDDPPSLLLLALIEQPSGFYIIVGAILLVLLVLSGLVSGSEVAFFSLSQQQLAKCKDSSRGTDKKIVRLIVHPKRLLATILIVNNFVNISIVTLSTYALWQLVGLENAQGEMIFYLSLVVTFAIVFFGEVIPKVYANQNNLRFARVTSGLLLLADTFFKPLSYTLMSLTSVIEKRIERRGYNVSADDLHQALEMTTDETTSEEEKDILRGIVNFSTITVTQVMKSRLDIVAIDRNIDFHELMDKINKSGFSRIPVFDDTIDNIAGTLYIKDLLPYLDETEDFEWQKLIRPSFFIPETKKIDSLLKDFQEKRIHMAIVVDEYGGTSGLITLEDVIEEIVGEIKDEFDDDEIAYHQIDESTFVFESKTTLNDFCKIIDIDSTIFDTVKGESESLGGLILEISAKFPRVGEKVYFDNFVFTVVSADQKRIKRVRVFIKKRNAHKESA